MPVTTNNKYLRSLLENLIISHETEINYAPIEIVLDPNEIKSDDVTTLLMFVSEPRKRLFIFKIPGDEQNSALMALTANRTILDQTAKTALQSTSAEPKINPLKQALDTSSSTVRAGIQIQKSFALPKQQKVTRETQVDEIEQTPLPDLTLEPMQTPDFPVLENQLKVLGIQLLHDAAAKKIAEHAHAFTDGIIPGNLPRGFYIDNDKHALCYTDNPPRLPSALAPSLEKPTLTDMPTPAQTARLLPGITPDIISKLLDTSNLTEQQATLLSVLSTHKKEITAFLQAVKPDDLAFIVPLLTKYFILGGEAHTCLFARLLKTCMTKNINLEFLKDPAAAEAFLSSRGIKNLQKLIKLPAEQKEWWNTLVSSHLENKNHHLDFNAFFEAYTQIFLPVIAEKNLTLPSPCPIKHKGHMLTTLNRIMGVIEHAANPQEQCLALTELNWGPTGAFYAMTDAPKAERMHQVASCMALNNPENTNTNPETIYQQLEDTKQSLTPWIFRYMGQHWKSNIHLADINEQLAKINQSTLTDVEKNQLIFITGTTFSNKKPLDATDWKQNLDQIIQLIAPMDSNDRNILLQALSRGFLFKPSPSLKQIQSLVEQCLELKKIFPDSNFKDELVMPVVSCLEHEGFEYLDSLQERIEKTHPASEPRVALTALHSLTNVLYTCRGKLNPDIIKMLVSINELELSNDSIDELMQALNKLQTKKGDAFAQVLSSLSGQINISKSQTLPKLQQIIDLINTLADSAVKLPPELVTRDKQETWLKDHIVEKNLLPGCVLGKGDISQLGNLIVDALVDMVKKRSAVLNIRSLKKELQGHLGNPLVPKALREQLDLELMPLLDALADLVELLQKPNPSFDELVAKLHFFEETKPLLMNGSYDLGGIIGKSKGEYLLSFLLTGKRKEGDEMTSKFFASLLDKVYGLISGGINDFFNSPKTKGLVKDLDAKTLFSWLETFNATHSIFFLFKEELVEKKVLPAIKKTLQQLNTQDPDFETNILEAASSIDESKPSDITITEYKSKIEDIASYLNTLIDIKDKMPATQFSKVYKQLQTGELARLNYQQKQVFINKLLKASPDSLDLYLQLAATALKDNPQADKDAIDRAIKGLVALFELTDLEPDTQTTFFKMSMAHNLKSSSPFPLAALNDLKQSVLPEKTKALILKQIIQILSRMKENDSPDLIQGMVQQIQVFLTGNPEQTDLCVELLKLVSANKPGDDLKAFQSILTKLSKFEGENRNKMATILAGLATRKKDLSVNLPTLLEITEGLERRTNPSDHSSLEQVLVLFKTPPYPIAQKLNAALRPQGSEDLKVYCQNFDTNPLGDSRPLSKHFATDRITDALTSLQDLMQDVPLSPALQMQLARQLTYIETLGYTDPLNPNDFSELKKLTAASRSDLQKHAMELLDQMRTKSVPEDQQEVHQLELLAYMREIYFRTTGLFLNTTQVLTLLISLHNPDINLLMSIKTGEGKGLITPMLAVLQWAQGGTVDVCTANRTLLARDYEESCEAFFTFLGIQSGIIQSDSKPEDYKLGGINFSTLEDMSLFRLAAKEAKQEALIQNDEPIHLVLDECDDALLDQTTLYKLVAETDSSDNPAQWIYPMAREFIDLAAFRNTAAGAWDEENDLEQFRMFLNKEIADKHNGNADKQNFLMASSNTQLRQWINASCKAAKLVENKDFIVQSDGNKMVCVPLVHSTPKVGCIFTDGVQQALQARMGEKARLAGKTDNFPIDADPPVLASQSANGLIQFYQNTQGRLVGISGTPGDTVELQYLNTILGTQAIGVAPHAGDTRKKHPPVFTTSDGDTITAIHRAIDSIKRPVTEATMVVDTSRLTDEERVARLKSADLEARKKWTPTQTQPILLVAEDFDAARKIKDSLADYEQAGFTVQIVTGKESPRELENIIAQAGDPNTITIGTAMLARGINIKPGNHPEGLFVIQAYTDSDRVNTQVAGRAARNGQRGQWTPIYQVKPPTDLLTRIWCFLSPSYRQKKHQEAVAKLQADIKLQDSIDRLYTKAIDKAQQTLMQQIKNWECLLLELYPEDPNLKYELYQWRQNLLNELTQYQEADVSQDTLDASISQFNTAITNLWEAAREEKWAARAQKHDAMTSEQALRLKYLKQADLMQECNIQDALQEQSEGFKAGTTALMHQNLDMMIQDKAGVVLSYTSPDEKTKEELDLAHCRQLLPNLIAEFCGLYPKEIVKFVPANSAKDSSFAPDALLALIKTAEQNNNHKPVVDLFQKALAKADKNEIQGLLKAMNPLIIEHANNLGKMPFIEQLKMRGLIVAISRLYQDSGLRDDKTINDIQTRFGDEVLKRVASYLTYQLDWAKETPRPLHALMERTIAVNAASNLYDLADAVKNDPHNKGKIHALYQALQEQKLVLQDRYLFSMGHSSVRNVINLALNAFETLNTEPFCSKKFQEKCHDKVLSKHHLDEFKVCLEELSDRYKNDADWNTLKTALETICNRPVKSQTHVIEELYQTIERISTYKACVPYLKPLNTLKTQLADSLAVLKKPDGLVRESDASLLAEKAAQFADIFEIKDKSKVHIQSGSDGIRSYIELQVEGYASPLPGFNGYRSANLDNLETEKTNLDEMISCLESNKEALLNLSDERTCMFLPSAKQKEFKKLFDLKNLLKGWDHEEVNSQVKNMPAETKAIMNNIHTLSQWDWTKHPVNIGTFKDILGTNPAQKFLIDLDHQRELDLKLIDIELEKGNASETIAESNVTLANYEEELKVKKPKFEKLGINIFETDYFTLRGEVNKLEEGITELKEKIAKAKAKLSELAEQENNCQDTLRQVNKQLDTVRTETITTLMSDAQISLKQYLPKASEQLIDSIQKEFEATEKALERLTDSETKKARYQTRRFFSTTELLQYEASLREEEANILKPIVETPKVSKVSMFKSDTSGLTTGLTPTAQSLHP